MLQIEQTVQLENLLTIPQLAKFLGVSRPTIYILMRTEGLPFIRLGGSIRFSPASIRAWLAEHEKRRTCYA